MGQKRSTEARSQEEASEEGGKDEITGQNPANCPYSKKRSAPCLKARADFYSKNWKTLPERTSVQGLSVISPK